MRRIAILDCPICVGEQVFVLYAPTETGIWDEHLCECEGCGYSYGYIDREPTTVVDQDGLVRTTYAPRPVLSREVLEGGMRMFQDRAARALVERHGADWRAQLASRRQFKAGVEAVSPADRARLLRSTAPGLRQKP